jgi:lipoprotein-anchoring transpeptidase ErfK/SrfK
MDRMRLLVATALAAVALLALPGVAAAAPATLTLSAAPPVVVAGSASQLTGMASDAALGTPLAGATLTLWRQRYDDATFSQVMAAAGAPLTFTTGADGSFAVAVKPAYNTTFEVRYDAEDDGVTDGAAQLLVRVRPRITTSFPSKDLWAGKMLTLKGSVAPAHPDPGSAGAAQVTIEQKIEGVWTTFKTLTLDRDSSFSTTWTPEGPGFKYLRVTMAADDAHAMMITTSRRLVINNPNPHHIPITYAHYIVIDHSEFRLYYYEHGRVIRKWDCVLGKPSTPTPYGHFTIQSKNPNPISVEGPRFLGYYGAIGIHGTNQPYLIRRFPRAFSHGCARLYNSEISWLYPRVPIGTPVWNIR